MNKERRYAQNDYLTKIQNSRGLFEYIENEINNWRENNIKIAVVYIDLDNFKKVNDTFGHKTGDALLYKTARILKDGVRATDIVARVGGDEFCMVLPSLDRVVAVEIVNRIRSRLLTYMKKNKYPVTMSAGVAVFTSPLPDKEKMIQYADKLMFKAKRQGKNTVCAQTI